LYRRYLLSDSDLATQLFLQMRGRK
jgi:hypothetical protein